MPCSQVVRHDALTVRYDGPIPSGAAKSPYSQGQSGVHTSVSEERYLVRRPNLTTARSDPPDEKYSRGRQYSRVSIDTCRGLADPKTAGTYSISSMGELLFYTQKTGVRFPHGVPFPYKKLALSRRRGFKPKVSSRTRLYRDKLWPSPSAPRFRNANTARCRSRRVLFLFLGLVHTQAYEKMH